jgi:UDP-N-acetylmuramoyl-tripeptide--D-alanyl-D-alanine ligase
MKNTFLRILKFFLRHLARLTLARYKPGIVGITGTVGKTSTKLAVHAVLKHSRTTRVSPKSFNNELGLPLTILGPWDEISSPFFWVKVLFVSLFNLFMKNPGYPEVLILEYGIDRPGDMKYLLDIARPHVGIFTAVGEIPVHVEFFAGPEAVAREKSKLIQHLPATGFAILNADDTTVFETKNQTRAQIITFGFGENADIRVSNFSQFFDGRVAGESFKLSYGGSLVPIRLENVLGRGQAYAAAAAVAVGLIFGMNLVKIAEALKEYVAAAGRLKVLPGIKETTIIDDTYNASPLAMREALDTLKSLRAKRKIAVLGDMLEIGKYTLEAHEEIGRLVAKRTNILLTIGLRGKFIAEAALKAGLPKKSIFSFMNVGEAGRFLQKIMQKGDLILVKASQGVRLEKIVKEVIADPIRADELLVRQSKAWLKKPGLYDDIEEEES